MSTNDKKVRLKIRLTVEEKTKLEHDAALCGLTQSEYFRQICLGKPSISVPVASLSSRKSSWTGRRRIGKYFLTPTPPSLIGKPLPLSKTSVNTAADQTVPAS